MFKNPIFTFFGGRKSFNLYLGIVLAIVWQVQQWPKNDLLFVLGLLGLTNGAIAYEDSRKAAAID